MRKLGVLVVHGMGKQADEHFAEKFITALRRRLARAGVDDDVVLHGGFWADILNDEEKALYGRLAEDRGLRWRRTREFVISHLGDALAYQRVPTHEGGSADVYTRIHLRIRDQLAALRGRVGGDAPLVIVAHSLGGTILSNYTWDQQHPEGKPVVGRDAFERMETLAGIITFGCNIPLFTLCLPRVQAIALPGAGVPASLVPLARWRNYYDADDVLGWPLRNLDPSYGQVEDVKVNVGGFLTMWNPASHSDYWDDADFQKPVAQYRGELAEALRR